jgi:hypothetical protein
VLILIGNLKSIIFLDAMIFTEHAKVRTAAQTFIDLANVWWDWN